MPKFTLILTRDSVCAGDDVDSPHEKKIELQLITNPTDFIENISKPYLPSVAGKNHAWDCLLNGKIIGTISAEEITAKVAKVEYKNGDRVYFKYKARRYKD